MVADSRALRDGAGIGHKAHPTAMLPRGAATADWVAATLAVFVVAWLGFTLFTDRFNVSVGLSEQIRSGEDAASAVARLFAALALSLVPREAGGRRLHWLAAGFLVLGLGHLAFGYIEPMLRDAPTPVADGRYEAFVVRTLAGLIFAFALIPSRPPRANTWAAFGIALVVVVSYLLLELSLEARLPELPMVDQPADVALLLNESTSWVSWAYIALAFAAAVGANRQHRLGNLPDWVLLAMVLWTGALLHDALWPASYSAAVLTTGDLLRLAFTVTVAIGAVVELRRIAAERAQLLEAEQEYSRRLGELSQMRADFNAMVIHELGAPATTIRNFTEVLADGAVRQADQAAIITMMRGESERMLALIEDVQSTAAVDREEFAVAPRPVAVSDLLDDARAFVTALRGDHKVTIVDDTAGAVVLADPMRIGQVLRNLLGNAAKYTPDGTPITLRASLTTGPQRVRFAVADRGDGIAANDLAHIFEKFGRGRHAATEAIAGKGLGLYLSRRIIRLHGSDLSVTSPPGAGAVFAFDLKPAAR